GRCVDHVDAAEMVIAVVESGERHAQPVPGLNAVSQLVGEQVFRAKVRAAFQEVWGLARNEELAVNARGCSDGPRDRRPQRPSPAGRPAHPTSGLTLESRVVVVLDLLA